MFPNGMVITPDGGTLVVAESWASRLTAFDIERDGTLSRRRVWANVGGDGITMDADGAIWASDIADGRPVVQRVREGGEILDQLSLDGACFACMLGGPDGRTLFMMVADWQGVEKMGEMFQQHTGRVLTTTAPAPHASRP
jgi:sugar lactone lactonase YvrE